MSEAGSRAVGMMERIKRLGIDEPWGMLAAAIAAQAADDYREALRWMRRYPHSEQANKMRLHAELFFRSHWFERLGGQDGLDVMDRIRRECGWTSKKR